MTSYSLFELYWCSVSIHTPTQGVTIRVGNSVVQILFQSTHPRRVWLIDIIIKIISKCFNPHTHAGCDIEKQHAQGKMTVSIHTPTQGVTSICSWSSTKAVSFNPHTHAGCDYLLEVQNRDHSSFNPHTHAGCDQFYTYCLYNIFVSIHTPTQGVTLKNGWSLCLHMFQSTHPRRVWRFWTSRR